MCTCIHYLVAALATEILRHMAVFQAVAQQPLFGHTIVKQRLYFVNHTVFKPLTEPDTYALDYHCTGKADTDDGVLHVGHVGIGFGVAAMVLLYFERAEQTVARFGIGMVMQLDISGQAGGELLVGNYGSRAFVTEDDTKVDVADINEVINIMLNH